MCSRTLGDTARTALVGTRFSEVSWLPETGSTNTDLMAWAAENPFGERVLVTDHQLAGKGTKGRTWLDEPGTQLMVSVLVRQDVTVAQAGRVMMAWSVATVDATAEVTGARIGLKWPNDLIDPGSDRKLAGVLAESVVVDGQARSIVIGMGMNVNGSVPEEVAGRAVALRDLHGSEVDRAQLLVAILRRFEIELAELGSVASRYRARSETIGREVRLVLPQGDLVTRVVDVDDDGLLVTESGGVRQTFASADVTHLR